MTKITLVFPIVTLIFLALIFSDYLPLLRRGTERLSLPGEGAYSRLDRALMAGITLCYAVTAFVNLGINTAPQTFCRFDDRGEYALIELAEPTDIGAVVYYSGLYSGNYYLQFSADGEDWTDQGEMSQSHAELFKWQKAELGENTQGVRYVRIIAGSRLWLGELAIYDADGRLLGPEDMSWPAGCSALFDEQDTIPDAASYLNSSYFDEIYHARTAYENVVGEYPYEISHPPLGKLIISLGIRIFGMTPFGWRFMGTLFGVFMLPLMYVFVKRMFGGTAVPACVTALMATDFMHFAQTRIATIDTYSVFFIILMYLFMYRYLTSERERLRDWLPKLALSGVFFGLGAASKWTCLYAGAGLGLLWLIDRVRRGISMKKQDRLGDYIRETAGNVLVCLVFFVLVPALTYYISYFPYGQAKGMSGIGMFFKKEYFDIVIDNQKYMFSYHSGVDATHPYSSRWWQWVLNIRPILYYLEYFSGGTKSTIGAFVNPILCWGGLAAILCMAYLALFRRDRKAEFILIGYLAQLVPWMFVSRITFEYHYFPCTVFLLLAMGHVLDTVRRSHREWKRVLFSLTGASLLLFVFFYPVLSGAEVSTWFANSFLRWLPQTWPF